LNSDYNASETPLKMPSAAHSGLIYRFEEYELDSSRWQLRWRGEALTVHRKSFDLLLYLLKKRPAVATKDELLSSLWPDQFVEENNLAQQVSTLRKALSRHGSGHMIIETVPGRGYRFAAEVEEASAPSAEAAAAVVLSAKQSITRITLEEELDVGMTDSAPHPDGLFAPGRRRLVLAAAFATILLAAIAGSIWHWLQSRTGGAPVQVVLKDMEGETGDSALDQALRDAVRFDLSQSPFVTVVSTATVSGTLKDMRRDPSRPLTEETANEVCERTNSQAVVRTVLARAGKRFLLTGEAISCVSGSILTSATQEADRIEDLRLAINRLIGHLRSRLGESRRSVARFSTPRFALETASLDALKAASQASILSRQGKFIEAITLEKQAITYDPNFAEAYYDLSAAYTSIADDASARASIAKAYELRNSVSPLNQLAIVSRYSQLVSRDLYEAERNAIAWTQLYPNFAIAWNSLSNVQKDLGNYNDAVEAARKAVKLRPDSSLLIAAYAQEQMRTGDLKGARASCEHAVSANPDYDFPHMILVRLAFAENDSMLSGQQIEWLAKHMESPMTISAEAEIAIAEGRFEEAKRYIARFADVSRKQGNQAAGSMITKLIAREMVIAGDREDGEAFFRQESLDADSPDDTVTLAVLGDSEEAERLLRQEITKFPKDTLLHSWYEPLTEGWRGLTAGRPKDALAALNQPGVLDERDYQVRLLRGDAYLADEQPKAAEAEFQKIVSHPEVDQSFDFTLGWLGLARALAAENNRTAAADAYRHFLSAWSHADSHAALLKTVQKEFSAL